MERQCAWCLHSMDNAGERISLLPSPKRYDVTHGICTICGTRWIEQALRAYNVSIEDAAELPVNVLPRSFTKHTMRLQSTISEPVS